MDFLGVLLLIVLLALVVLVIFRSPAPASKPSTTTVVPSSLPLSPMKPEGVDNIPLDAYYTPARAKVELDYPPKEIGCCPFSKPQSKDLPIANIPMCYAGASQTYLSPLA